MTKRTLFIIIAMLLVLDVLSFITYVVTNSNSDGKNPLSFNVGPQPAAVVADTIPDTVIPDEFDTLARHVTYAAIGQPATCTIRLKVVWPVKVNGSDNLSNLHRQLLTLMGATGDGNITAAVNRLAAAPAFDQQCQWRAVATMPDSALNNPGANFICCRVYPIFTSQRLLEMAVLNEKRVGGTLTRALHAVHYDRLHHTILTNDEIFNPLHTDDVLAFVNRSIERLKAGGRFPTMHETDSLPPDFILTGNAVSFYFRDGTISPLGKGMHEVTVSNIELRPYFTDYYNEILSNDSHYLNYGFLNW